MPDDQLPRRQAVPLVYRVTEGPIERSPVEQPPVSEDGIKVVAELDLGDRCLFNFAQPRRTCGVHGRLTTSGWTPAAG
ncbi:unnamed protein product [Ectocarpus sp. CCAP 1310/34]|nr:unnamed protein product [Ectocarpus sp. CCAP 1310/34]